MIARAVLVRRVTEDGIVEMRDEVPLGKVYNVRMESLRVSTIYNMEKKRTWRGHVVEDADHPGEWLPMELLDIQRRR